MQFVFTMHKQMYVIRNTTGTVLRTYPWSCGDDSIRSRLWFMGDLKQKSEIIGSGDSYKSGTSKSNLTSRHSLLFLLTVLES